MDEGRTDWLDGELAACNLADEHLTKRLRKLLGQIGGAMGCEFASNCDPPPKPRKALKVKGKMPICRVTVRCEKWPRPSKIP